MADFNYFLNRQGIRGLQGIKGDQGDSPIITVQTETPNEYILKITSPDGTELISPNLRGNKININEGTYVRYNTETGELYTSTVDGATGELAGVVRLATDADITNMDERAVVTPSQLADALSKYLVSPDGSVKIVQNVENSLTELTVESTVQVIDQLKSDVSTLQNEVSVLNTEIDTKSPKLTAGENITLTPQDDGTIKIGSTGGLTDLPIATATTLGGVKIGNNLSITEDGTLSATGGSAPTNMVTTDTTQTITGNKTFTQGITTTDIYPAGEITFNSTSQHRHINNIDTIGGGYRTQNGYITFKGDTTLVGDNKLILDGRTGGLKLTAASSANITCENTLIAPNIRTTANGTIKLTHPMNNASGLITLSNNYGQLSIASSLGDNNNLLGVTRGTAYALINGDNITTRDKDGNERVYINTGNLAGSDNITISSPTDTVAAKIDISQTLLNRITILETTVASLQTQIGEISAQLDAINGEVI